MEENHMLRNWFFKLFSTITVLALVFSQVIIVKAAKIDFGGEDEDHFWDVELTALCKDGFTISANELYHDESTSSGMGDELAFSLQLGASDVSVRDSLPAQIVGNPGGAAHTALVSGSRTFLFSSLQSVGTSVDLTIERWDHGLLTAHETTDPNEPSDHSVDFDDIKHIKEDDGVTKPAVADCLIDSVAPSITITSPLAQNYPQSGTVSTTWNVTDALSGVASSSGAVDGNPVSNGQTLNLSMFMPGPHTLTVNASDKSGNTAQASVNFNVVVTIDSLINATQNACSMGWISSSDVCKGLMDKLLAAKSALSRGQTQSARGSLNAFLNQLKAQKGKSVNQSAYDLLSADARALMH
jgi:FIMAH domain-containing protein